MGEAATALETAQDTSGAIIERVVMQGDLAKLTPEQRVGYYRRVCDSLALNPFTRPFDYLVLNGKLTLYAKRDATDQIRFTRKVSVTITARERVDDLYIVTARAELPDGRTDESVGAVSIAGLKGEALANAIMKAETKAKRRVTLSISGLGMMDESEVSSVAEARYVDVDMETGEVLRTHDASPANSALPPAQTTGNASQTRGGTGGCTEAQRKACYALARKAEADKDTMSAAIKSLYGADKLDQLTKAQASDLIDRLQRAADGKEGLDTALGFQNPDSEPEESAKSPEGVPLDEGDVPF